MKNPWILFLDDLRNPPDDSWTVARSSIEALEYVNIRGLPQEMSLDHDLGGDDTTMEFLKKLIPNHLDSGTEVPKYMIHSQNPVGKANIISMMESWKKIVNS